MKKFWTSFLTPIMAALVVCIAFLAFDQFKRDMRKHRESIAAETARVEPTYTTNVLHRGADGSVQMLLTRTNPVPLSDQIDVALKGAYKLGFNDAVTTVLNAQKGQPLTNGVSEQFFTFGIYNEVSAFHGGKP